MSTHPPNDELDLYALGTLEDDARRELESHVTECAECRRALAESSGRVALLAFAAEPRAPSAPVRSRLLAQVRAQGREEEAAMRRFGWPRLAWATAVVLALVAVFLARENRKMIREMDALQSQFQARQAELARAQQALAILTSAETLRVPLTYGEEKPRPEGKVLFNRQRGLLFFATRLPALAANQTYQLWLVPSEGNPISAGIFRPDEKGDGSILLPEVAALPAGVEAKAFAVTIEPAGGVPQPTGPKVLVGLVS
jgi:anti-sigma-K factor RskA